MYPSFCGVAEHLLHPVHAGILIKLLCVSEIPSAAGFLFLRMLYPEIYLSGKRRGVAVTEQIVLTEGKEPRRTPRRIGNDRDKTAGDRFKAGYRLNLDLGGMNVKVGIIQHVKHLLAAEEPEQRLIFQLLCRILPKLLLKRSVAGKNQLYPVGILRFRGSIDKNPVRLLLAVPSGKENDESVPEILRLFGRAADKAFVDAV